MRQEQGQNIFSDRRIVGYLEYLIQEAKSIGVRTQKVDVFPTSNGDLKIVIERDGLRQAKIIKPGTEALLPQVKIPDPEL